MKVFLQGLIIGSIIVAGGMIGISVQANATEDKPSICHPVNGNGELGNGWNLIEPNKASSHIDEALYPDGEYWKHEAKDGRHDVYAVDGKCPGEIIPEPTLTPTPTPTVITDPDPEPTDEPTLGPAPTTPAEPTPVEHPVPNTGA